MTQELQTGTAFNMVVAQGQRSYELRSRQECWWVFARWSTVASAVAMAAKDPLPRRGGRVLGALRGRTVWGGHGDDLARRATVAPDHRRQHPVPWPMTDQGSALDQHRHGARDRLRPDRDITDPRVAKALAHPLRLRILGVLEERVASPKELALALDASLGVVSYHVRVLLRAGFLELVGAQRRRGAIEHYYRAVSRPAVTSEVWEQMPDVVKQELVGTTLAKVSAHVNLAARTGGFERRYARLTRSPLVLDDQAVAQIATKLDKLLADLERIAAAAERRLKHRDHQDEIRATAVLMLFDTPVAPTPA